MQPTKAESAYRDAPLKDEEGTPSIFGIMNYLGKFSPSTADIC